jgi:hypothetical protein
VPALRPFGPIARRGRKRQHLLRHRCFVHVQRRHAPEADTPILIDVSVQLISPAKGAADMALPRVGVFAHIADQQRLAIQIAQRQRDAASGQILMDALQNRLSDLALDPPGELTDAGQLAGSKQRVVMSAAARPTQTLIVKDSPAIHGDDEPR